MTKKICLGFSFILGLFISTYVYAHTFSIPLKIQSGKTFHQFSVEIADTLEKREKGLMFVEHLQDQTGMLFKWDQERRVSFWMKNTPISLDLLFIKSDGQISDIIEKTTPNSLDRLTTQEKVQYVLEIKGGESNRLKIKKGDYVLIKK